MKRVEKAERIQEILAELYPDPPIPLHHRDEFTLLVAVVLSAQTTDERVNMVTPALFDVAPTPKKLAALDTDEIHALIRTVGLAPRRRRTSRRSASGSSPSTAVGFRAASRCSRRSRVGHKTASVVMCQAFHVPAFPVDTHIHRLAWRWGLSSGKNVARTELDLKRVFPRSRGSISTCRTSTSGASAARR
jgi:endonuclease-3